MPQQDEAREQGIETRPYYSIYYDLCKHPFLAQRPEFTEFLADFIHQNGYRKIDPAKLTLIGDEEIKNERYTFLEGETIDEAVLYGAMVHLESLDDGCYMLIMSNERHHWHFNIFSKSRRAQVVAKIYEDTSPARLHQKRA